MKVYKYDKKEARKNKYNDNIVFYPVTHLLFPCLFTFLICFFVWVLVPYLHTNIIYILSSLLFNAILAILLLRTFINKEAWYKTVFVVFNRQLYMLRKINSFDAGSYIDAIYEYETNGFSYDIEVTRLRGAIVKKNYGKTFVCEYDDYDDSTETIEIPNAYPNLISMLDKGYTGSNYYFEPDMSVFD